MLISDIFNEQMVADHGSGDYSPAYYFWEIELAISRTNGLGYSNLEEMQLEKDRQCGLCGDIAHTDKHGDSLYCSNETCGLVRDFFGMSNFKRPLQAQKSQRGVFFRAKLIEFLGVGQVYKIDIENRLEACLALMLLRISMETKNDHE